MRSVSVVSRATCSATGEPVVVKAYELARMRAKDSRRLAREIAIMRRLDRMEGMARLLPGSSHPVYKKTRLLLSAHCTASLTPGVDFAVPNMLGLGPSAGSALAMHSQL